ncbi:hypothetical protein [Spirulina subsalsa]|uniref:hypothetical protein n=1 Tax=Spirulina subsalsa TaxID=54311 RepID=UPI0002E5B348|nr:hypothetical protein [Spirulina subsalsa]
MPATPNLLLRNARPDNQIHLLLWDRPLEPQLEHLVFYNNAERVNYRQNLQQRLPKNTRFLTLHLYLERELEALKSICKNSQKSMILLEGLDCLITYLHTQPESSMPLFWHYLKQLRNLETLLWILLPSRLKPPDWPKNRLYSIDSF